jgi:hypothetical protein
MRRGICIYLKIKLEVVGEISDLKQLSELVKQLHKAEKRAT